MFIRTFTLFRAFGFPIRIDLSWIFIAVLVAWSLASLFRHQDETLTPAVYWTMGVLGALGLFTSVVLHELGHALVARRFGIEMKGITLFIFGGVAEMTREPPSARAEFWVAVGGPIVSVALCVLLLGAAFAIPWPSEVEAVVRYLGWINGVLVVFNMVPAFPLDGGRVLRSILWHVRGSLRWATRVTSAIGAAFGWLLIGLGLLMLFYGQFVAAIWWFLLGMFLRNAAQMSYQQLLIRRALEGEPVSRFMRRDPVTVPPDLTVQELVDHYVYRHHFKMYPVVENGELRGCITLAQIKNIPREQWPQRRVGELAVECSGENTLPEHADAMEALAKMSRNRVSRVMIVSNGHLAGMLALKDLMEFLALKVELEERSA